MAKGEYLLFLNDDVEAFQPEWLERMVGHAQQKHVGVVGAKLFYPETTKIQHAGVGNIKTGPCHNFLGCDDTAPLYFGFNWIDYNCIAVTGACMLVSASNFWEINGFDESLSVTFNDVNLCFSLYKKGYYNVVRNDVILFHHESLSRGFDYLDDTKLMRSSQELEKVYLRFPEFKQQDPFVNRNICVYREILETSIMTDTLKVCDLNTVSEGGCGKVDIFDIAEQIRILGWSYLEDDENIDRYLVFMDPFGNAYQAPVISMLRQDVADCFGNGTKYQYAGFECVLDKAQLRIDIMPYRIGVLSCNKDGNRIITWMQDSSSIVRSHTIRPMICVCHVLHGFIKHEKNVNVQWYIDYIQKKEIYYEIGGYAFCIGDEHFQYKKSLVLLDKDNDAYEFQVHNEERVDVAIAFPEQHFLYNTGFKCYILKEALESGREYEVVIRLRNQFDSDDIKDVITNQKVITI